MRPGKIGLAGSTGAQIGPNVLSNSGSGVTSFQDFQESVDDAWDSGDDEFCTVSDVKISRKVSHSAALSVINSHRTAGAAQINCRDHRQDVISEEKKAEALQRLAVQPLRLRNAAMNAQESQSINQNLTSDGLEAKNSGSPQHRSHQFPGRPQPLRQMGAPPKFFIPSKEQGENELLIA